MQFGFVPGKGTMDAIFMVRQLQEKFLEKRKDLFFAFVDLEKAFDRVPREVVRWELRQLGVEEWLVQTVMTMYERASSQTTRLLIKERFNRALLDTLDHASHNVIEAKMRVCVSQVINRNHARLYLIVKRLQKQGYLIYDVVMNIVEELFEDESSWYFIMCLCT